MLENVKPARMRTCIRLTINDKEEEEGKKGSLQQNFATLIDSLNGEITLNVIVQRECTRPQLPPDINKDVWRMSWNHQTCKFADTGPIESEIDVKR